MKQTFMRTSVIIVLLGLPLFTSACTTNSDSQNTSTSYEEKKYNVDAEKVTQLSLNARDRTVELVKSTDKQIHINYFESDKESYEINVSDNKELTMEVVNNKNWKDYIGLDTDKAHRNVKIAVPSGIASGVKIKTSNGDIVFSEVNIKGSVEASISNGNIAVNKVVVDDTLKLKSKNGDITGTVKGSYDVFSISSKASKGKNNLPENKGGGAKTLDVSTNNGDINLEFVD